MLCNSKYSKYQFAFQHAYMLLSLIHVLELSVIYIELERNESFLSSSMVLNIYLEFHTRIHQRL